MDFWEKREKLIKDNPDIKDVGVRNTYRSMACVLDTISKAMKNPDEIQDLYDHSEFVSGLNNNVKMAERILKELGIGGFLINKGKGQLIFSLKGNLHHFEAIE